MEVSLAMKLKQVFIGGIMTLLTGSLIYASFRSRTLIMFRWFDELNIIDDVNQLRAYCHSQELHHLPDFVKYALPDGLWVFSYMSITLYLWDNKVDKDNFLWIFGLPTLALLSEIGQHAGSIPGTFDIADLLMYLLGIFLPLFIYKIELTNLKTINI